MAFCQSFPCIPPSAQLLAKSAQGSLSSPHKESSLELPKLFPRGWSSRELGNFHGFLPNRQHGAGPCPPSCHPALTPYLGGAPWGSLCTPEQSFPLLTSDRDPDTGPASWGRANSLLLQGAGDKVPQIKPVAASRLGPCSAGGGSPRVSDHPAPSPVSNDTWLRVALSSLPASRRKLAMNDFSFLMSCTKVSEAPYFLLTVLFIAQVSRGCPYGTFRQSLAAESKDMGVRVTCSASRCQLEKEQLRLGELWASLRVTGAQEP